MANGDPNQQFLKSTAAAMRAVAGGVEHQVSYAGTDTHVGKAMFACRPCRRAPRRSSGRACAVPPTARRCGWRITTEKTHRKLCPSLDGARAIFESAERARVEAIGALDLKGVGDNLEAALNQRYETRQIDAPGQADETGIAEVVRLLRPRKTDRRSATTEPVHGDGSVAPLG